MYWLDTVILVLLGLGAGLGFWSGLLWQVARVMSLGLALYATVLCNEPVTELFGEALAREVDPRVLRGAAYVAVFLGVYLGLFLLTGLLHRTIKAAHLDLVDRVLGALLGAAKVGAVVAVACAALGALSLPQARECMAHSALAPLFARGTEAGLELVPDEYRSRVGEGLQTLRDSLQPNLPRPAPDDEPGTRDPGTW